MDKKREMNFNLNNFLLAVSSAIDYSSFDKYNRKINYSKRVAYIALNIGKLLNLNPQEMSDLCSYCLSSQIASLQEKRAQNEFERETKKMTKDFPFLLKSEDLSLLLDILGFSKDIEEKFDLTNNSIKNREKIELYLSQNSTLYSNKIINSFLELSKKESFYLDLQNENEILIFIFSNLYDFTKVLSFEEILNITKVCFDAINPNSKLLAFGELMSDFYKFEHKDKQTFLIALSLQNIGKAFIPSSILNKPSSLDSFEYEIMKSYPYYTKKVLSNIMGFNDICSWAYKVQEGIDERGYPFGLSGKDLSFKDRLLATLVAYDSLRSKKIYRDAKNHIESIKELQILTKEGFLDNSIVEDLNKVLKE